MPGEVAYDDPVPVPLADLTTGDPISHATFGVSLDVLKSRILWSWPEHVAPDDISFQAEGGLRLRDDANTAAMTIESMAETPPPHPHGNKRYVRSAFEIVVGEEAMPVFVHEWDRTEQEDAGAANARTKFGNPHDHIAEAWAALV